MRLTALLLSASVLLSAPAAIAGENHTLFNPTPNDELRPMTTERSSKTDSPYSLDAGRVQLETDLYAYVRNNDCIADQCTASRQSSLDRFTNLRIGLTDTMDLQIAADIYRQVTVDDRTNSTQEKHEGFGDTVVRLKKNIVGNLPSDEFSLAVLPFLKIPTNQDNLGNDKYEGGLAVPFSFALADTWSLGVLTQLSFIAGADGSGYDPAYTNSVALGKTFGERWSTYAEFYTFKADQPDAHWINTVDFGAAYQVTESFRVDANLHLGVTDAADDVNAFFGAAYRF
jgi:hypothetical protein